MGNRLGHRLHLPTNLRIIPRELGKQRLDRFNNVKDTHQQLKNYTSSRDWFGRVNIRDSRECSIMFEIV